MFRKSEYSRVPTTGLGYAMATLVGGALSVVVWFFVMMIGYSEGWLQIMHLPGEEPPFLNRHGSLMFAVCVVVATGSTILIYRMGRGKMAS